VAWGERSAGILRGQALDRVDGSGGAAAVALPRGRIGRVGLRLVTGKLRLRFPWIACSKFWTENFMCRKASYSLGASATGGSDLTPSSKLSNDRSDGGGHGWKKAFLFIVFATSFIYLFLYIKYPPYRFSVKYNLVVETPDGYKKSSSVIILRYRFLPSWITFVPHRVHYFSMLGEAVVLNVGGNRYLFMLTVRNGMEYLPFMVLAPRFGLAEADYRALAKKIANFRGVVEVPRRLYPLLVTFDDVNDPKTVKKVDPDDLAATFGPGYRLKSITIEITDEPVTRGKVEKVLGWIYDPKLLKNPVWRTLPEFVQEVIQGLRQPGGPK